jgi:heme exporter protein A
VTLLLDAQGVALVRGGRLLFDELDLNLAPGDGLHLSGPNGSGKTSLIRLIAGLLRPNAGTIRRGAVALADEHAALDRELPLGRALAFWGGSSPDAAIAAFGLEALAAVPVRLLSAGQLKRAALARVMASGAPLWLLDEPHNGLDHASRDRLDGAIAAHRAGGGAVVAASHQALAGEWRMLELGQGAAA